jgi:hypothetical protein
MTDGLSISLITIEIALECLDRQTLLRSLQPEFPAEVVRSSLGAVGFASREAITETKKSDVVSAHLDRGYNSGLSLDPKTIRPDRHPDVLSVYSDGRVARVEVK